MSQHKTSTYLTVLQVSQQIYSYTVTNTSYRCSYLSPRSCFPYCFFSSRQRSPQNSGTVHF